jgi:hypothetical protein
MSASGRPTLAEWAIALAFGLAILASIGPWPAPSVRLREVCELREAGWFGADCDLAAAAARADAPWLRKRIHIFEDGLRLVEAPGWSGPEGDARGTYFTNGAHVTFSALVRGHPLSNGRTYVARPQRWDPLGVAEHRPEIASVLVLAGAAVCLVRRRRARAQAWTIAALVSAAALVVQLTAARHALVHVDAGDTLGAAEAIQRGASPYGTLYYSPYTPLGAYAFALWGVLWPGGGLAPYDWYVGLVVSCAAAGATIVFLLLVRHGVDRGLALVTALSLVSMTLLFDGARVLHEPLYLLLVLASAWIVIARPGTGAHLAAGALVGAAFLVKQYGGFGLWGLLAYAVLGGPGRLRRAVGILAGFGAALALLGVLLVLMGADPRALARGIVPNARAAYQWVFFEVFLRECAILVPALMVPLLPGAWSRPVVRLAVCFGLASCLPLVFRQHEYYFLNLCPWIFLLFAAGLDLAPPRARTVTVAAGLGLLATIPLRAAVADARVIEADWRADQLRRAYVMTQIWPAEKPTFVFVHGGIQHLTHYRSPDEAVVGYRYIVDLDAERIREGLRRAAGAWVDPRTMYARRPGYTLKAAGSSLEEELERSGMRLQLVLEDRFQLWTKEPLSRRQKGAAGAVSFEEAGGRDRP